MIHRKSTPPTPAAALRKILDLLEDVLARPDVPSEARVMVQIAQDITRRLMTAGRAPQPPPRVLYR
jgi:hypothetical protein